MRDGREKGRRKLKRTGTGSQQNNWWKPAMEVMQPQVQVQRHLKKEGRGGWTVFWEEGTTSVAFWRFSGSLGPVVKLHGLDGCCVPSQSRKLTLAQIAADPLPSAGRCLQDPARSLVFSCWGGLIDWTGGEGRLWHSLRGEKTTTTRSLRRQDTQDTMGRFLQGPARGVGVGRYSGLQRLSSPIAPLWGGGPSALSAS